MHTNLIELIDENFNLHAKRIPALSAGMEVLQTNNITYVNSGLSCDTFNIIHITNGKALSKHEVAEVLAYYRERNLDYCLWISQENLTPSVHHILQDFSLTQQNEEIGMILDLQTFSPTQSPHSSSIKRVDSEELLATYAQVIAANWTPPDQNVLSYYQQTSSHYLSPTSHTHLFLNYEETHPASTLELFATNKEVTGIYGFATVEKYRGKGIGSQLMAYSLGYAKDRGYRYVILQATEDGIGIYKRYGFREVTKYYEFA